MGLYGQRAWLTGMSPTELQLRRSRPLPRRTPKAYEQTSRMKRACDQVE